MPERSPTLAHISMQEKSCIELMGFLQALPKTDRNESSRSKSTVSTALDRCHPLHPKVSGIDDQHPSDDGPLARMTATSNPKGQDAASGHPPERSDNRQEYLQAHVQLWEEKSRLGHLLTSQNPTDRTSPDSEKKDQGKETYPSDASSNACRSRRWTSDDDACWVARSPDAADGRTSRAQQ